MIHRLPVLRMHYAAARKSQAGSKVLDKQSQLMNSPCGDQNKELNHKEENQ